MFFASVQTVTPFRPVIMGDVLEDARTLESAETVRNHVDGAAETAPLNVDNMQRVAEQIEQFTDGNSEALVNLVTQAVRPQLHGLARSFALLKPITAARRPGTEMGDFSLQAQVLSATKGGEVATELELEQRLITTLNSLVASRTVHNTTDLGKTVWEAVKTPESMAALLVAAGMKTETAMNVLRLRAHVADAAPGQGLTTLVSGVHGIIQKKHGTIKDKIHTMAKAAGDKMGSMRKVAEEKMDSMAKRAGDALARASGGALLPQPAAGPPR